MELHASERCGIRMRKVSFGTRIELTIYQWLGVYVFRRLVCWLDEKCTFHNVYRRNYHIDTNGILSVEKFCAYLFYNVILHIGSVFTILLFFLLCIIFDIQVPVLTVCMVILLVLNLYCILLQRMHYIRIKNFCVRYYQRRNQIISRGKEVLLRRINTYTESQIRNDYDLTQKICFCIKNGEFYSFTDEDIVSLRRIKESLSELRDTHLCRNFRRNKKSKLLSMQEVVNRAMKKRYIYTYIDEIDEKIVKFFKVKYAKSFFFDIGMVTLSKECEDAYRSVFPTDSAENTLLILELLLQTYRTRLGLTEGA